MVFEKLRQGQVPQLLGRRVVGPRHSSGTSTAVETTLGLLLLVLLQLPASARAEQLDISGAWDWHNRLQTKDGDIRSEKESWLLVQDGNEIRGSYQRKVTFLSTKNRPYACNGLVRYQRIAVYRIEGTIQGSHVTLKEKAVQVQPGPCDDGQRRLDSYQGDVRSGKLYLRWPGGREVLERRNLTGLWMGKAERSLRGGDQATWMEMWRLRQVGNQVEGLRDRTDVRLSGDGQAYRCSQSLKIVRSSRWTIQGRLQNNHLILSLSHPLRRRTPCEKRTNAPQRLSIALDYDPDTMKLSGGDVSLVLNRQTGISPGIGPAFPASPHAPRSAKAIRR